MNAFKHPSLEALKCIKVFHVKGMLARFCFPSSLLFVLG
jgi:hypothetical protein